MRFTCFFLLLINYNLFAQFPAPNLVLVKDYSQSLNQYLYFSEKKVNTSFKPIVKSNLLTLKHKKIQQLFLILKMGGGKSMHFKLLRY